MRRHQPARGRRNPTRTVYEGPSALTLAEAGILQDAILIVGGTVIVGVAGYLLWQWLNKNPGTPQDAIAQILGYHPGPGTTPGPPTQDFPGGANPSNTLPNPSTISGGAHGTQPWLPSGPVATNDPYSGTDLGTGGSQDPLGGAAGVTAYA
jgi:hypothetical protein